MSNLYLDLLKIPANHEAEHGAVDTAKAFVYIKTHSKKKIEED